MRACERRCRGQGKGKGAVRQHGAHGGGDARPDGAPAGGVVRVRAQSALGRAGGRLRRLLPSGPGLRHPPAGPPASRCCHISRCPSADGAPDLSNYSGILRLCCLLLQLLFIIMPAMKVLMHRLPPSSGQDGRNGCHEGLTCTDMPHVQSRFLSADRSIIVLRHVTLSNCRQ